jgi:hypothetical protein
MKTEDPADSLPFEPTPGAAGPNAASWGWTPGALDGPALSPSLLPLYLAGKMTGVPDWNFPLFHRVALALRQRGWDVVNPAENFDGDTSLSWETYLRHAVKQVSDCGAIGLLPGWEDSKGARLEALVAHSLGLRTFLIEESDGGLRMSEVREDGPVREEDPLAVAQRLVDGERQSDYGHPAEDFAKTGLMWGALLWHWRHSEEAAVPAWLVSLMMVGVKLSREVHLHKEDNIVDAAGYLRTRWLIRRDTGR